MFMWTYVANYSFAIFGMKLHVIYEKCFFDCNSFAFSLSGHSCTHYWWSYGYVGDIRDISGVASPLAGLDAVHVFFLLSLSHVTKTHWTWQPSHSVPFVRWEGCLSWEKLTGAINKIVAMRLRKALWWKGQVPEQRGAGMASRAPVIAHRPGPWRPGRERPRPPPLAAGQPPCISGIVM